MRYIGNNTSKAFVNDVEIECPPKYILSKDHKLCYFLPTTRHEGPPSPVYDALSGGVPNGVKRV